MRIQLLLPFLVFATALFGQQTLPQQAESSAEIKFDEPVHSFGTLKKGANCTFDFKFKNVGSAPLIISNWATSCGCDMVTSFPKQPILPGQTGVITYYYDSYRIGVFQKSLTVYSNAKTPSVVLKTCGQIYDPSSPDTYSSKSYTNCNCGQKTYTSSEQIVSKKTDSTSVSPTITINVYPNPSSSQ